MEIDLKNNQIYIKYKDIAILNANIYDEHTIFIDILKVKRAYRNQNFAKMILQNAIDNFKNMGFKQIKLNALPLDSQGLNLDQLKNFYKKFNFFETNEKHNSNEMIKYL